MLKKVIFIFLFVALGCKNSAKEDTYQKDITSVETTSTKISNPLGEVLTPQAKELVESWNEYTAVENILSEYYNITVTKAIDNAQELSLATQQLKDSIRVDRFNEPDFKIRLNVLHNSALRLQDMGQITQVNNEDVKIEVSNLLNSFTSINSKLNNIVNKKQLNQELTNF